MEEGRWKQLQKSKTALPLIVDQRPIKNFKGGSYAKSRFVGGNQ
jgi:hypothetical protein